MKAGQEAKSEKGSRSLGEHRSTSGKCTEKRGRGSKELSLNSASLNGLEKKNKVILQAFEVGAREAKWKRKKVSQKEVFVYAAVRGLSLGKDGGSGREGFSEKSSTYSGGVYTTKKGRNVRIKREASVIREKRVPLIEAPFSSKNIHRCHRKRQPRKGVWILHREARRTCEGGEGRSIQRGPSEKTGKKENARQRMKTTTPKERYHCQRRKGKQLKEYQ